MKNNDTEVLSLPVFVSAGQSPLGGQVAEYIEQKLGHEAVVYTPSVNDGRSDIARLEQATDECSFAVIVMAEDDARPREVLLHELGFCQGSFGRENVLVLKQEAVADISGFSGIVYALFSGNDIKSVFKRLQAEIDAAIARFENEDDDEEDDD